MGQIYLVRHGQASFGTADYDRLSALGFEQARLLGGWFADCGQEFGRAVTGSLRRHRETADACLAALPEARRPAAQADPAFDEFDHEDMLRRHRPEFADAAAMQAALAAAENPRRAFQEAFAEAMERWLSGRHDGEYRETWAAFRARCVGALRRLIERAGAAQSTVVFTSGGPIAAICQELLGVPDGRAIELNASLANGSVTKLLCRPGRVGLAYLNGIPHLERTGRRDTISYR